MGIYDRDYYRHEPRGWLQQSGMTVVTRLIILNVIVFFFQLATMEQGRLGWFTELFLMDPDKVLGGQVWRLLTSAFLHSPGSLWHILINMLVLFFFGRDIEYIYGRREFLAMYLAAAVFANLISMGVALVGWDQKAPSLGASGAISAVFILYALHYPHRSILLFFIIPVPAWLLAILFVGRDAFSLLSQSPEPVAFAAHLGGALFGFLYFRYQFRVMSWVPNFGRLFGNAQRRKPRNRANLRVYEEDKPEPVRTSPARSEASVGSPPAPPEVPVDEHLEAKLDAVLEKVARHGKESLTEDERNILMRASEIYKRKRK